MANLTISQALRKISKLKGKVAELQTRAAASVSYRFNHEPAFPFGITKGELEKALAELVQLQVGVAVTNARTSIDFNGRKMTLTEVICQLQELKGQIAWYRTLSVKNQALTQEEERTYDDDINKYVHVTIKWTCCLPEADRAVVVDDLQNKFDSLNDVVEKANHITVLEVV